MTRKEKTKTAFVPRLKITTFANLKQFWNSKTEFFWIRPTDLSWHYPVLVTIREMPFKNYRGRSSEKSKAREKKIEETKEEKTKRSEDQ